VLLTKGGKHVGATVIKVHYERAWLL